jgi:hypothetical protein
MKAKILTTTPIKKEWLDEVRELIPGIEFDVSETKEKLQVWYNPMQNSMVGVFAHLRQLVNAPTGYKYRVYVMTEDERIALGMTSHKAMYDHLDRDWVLDFYMGLPRNLTATARANGFRSNFAWLFVHESLHGDEQERDGNKSPLYPDRVHDWELQSRLKELAQYHAKRRDLMKQVSLLQRIVELTKTLVGLKKN